MTFSGNYELIDTEKEIPRYYGEDRLVLLPRDPFCMYAYWEISLPTREKVFGSWDESDRNEAVLSLRVFRHDRDKKGSVESFYDHRVGDDTDNWYINVNHADNFYHAELGWILPGGIFHSVLKSNIIRTPRDSISNIIDENWKLPDWKSRRLFRRISLYHLSSAELIHRKSKNIYKED